MNGLLSVDGAFISYNAKAFPFIGGHSIIAPFWSDIDTRHSKFSNLTNGSAIYYHVYSKKHSSEASKLMLQMLTDDIRRYSNELLEYDIFREFNATWALVTTWFQVAPYDGFIYQDIEVLSVFCGQ